MQTTDDKQLEEEKLCRAVVGLLLLYIAEQTSSAMVLVVIFFRNSRLNQSFSSPVCQMRFRLFASRKTTEIRLPRRQWLQTQWGMWCRLKLQTFELLVLSLTKDWMGAHWADRQNSIRRWQFHHVRLITKVWLLQPKNEPPNHCCLNRIISRCWPRSFVKTARPLPIW